jgi:hypothetical protein
MKRLDRPKEMLMNSLYLSSWIPKVSQRQRISRRRKLGGVTQIQRTGIECLEARQLLSATCNLPVETSTVADTSIARVDKLVHLSWSSPTGVTVTEGDAGSQTIALDIVTSRPARKDIIVTGHFGFTGLGAGHADGDDFQIAPFTVTIKKGQSSTTVHATVFGDTTIEPDEDFMVKIDSAGSKAVIDQASDKITILNDDESQNGDLPTVSFGGGSSYLVSDEGLIEHFTLALNKISATDVSVTVHLSGGTGTIVDDNAANVPGDAQFADGSSDLIVIIPAGTLTQTFGVQLIDDQLVEETEDYTATITSASDATVGPVPTQFALIEDTDGPPKVFIFANTTVTEGDSGTTSAPVNVALFHATNVPVTVNYVVEADRAIDAKHRAKAKKDFVVATGSIVIPAGQTIATLPIQIVGDQKAELDEKFQVRVTSVAGGTLLTSGNIGIVTIIDNDGNAS